MGHIKVSCLTVNQGESDTVVLSPKGSSNEEVFNYFDPIPPLSDTHVATTSCEPVAPVTPSNNPVASSLTLTGAPTTSSYENPVAVTDTSYKSSANDSKGTSAASIHNCNWDEDEDVFDWELELCKMLERDREIEELKRAVEESLQSYEQTLDNQYDKQLAQVEEHENKADSISTTEEAWELMRDRSKSRANVHDLAILVSEMAGERERLIDAEMIELSKIILETLEGHISIQSHIEKMTFAALKVMLLKGMYPKEYKNRQESLEVANYIESCIHEINLEAMDRDTLRSQADSIYKAHSIAMPTMVLDSNKMDIDI